MAMSTLPEDIDRGVAGATSVLVQRANEIRLQKVNWPSYLQSQMITQEDYEVIMAVEVPGQNRQILLNSRRLQVARTFMNLLGHISKDQTIQYILILVDDILSEEKSRVEIFKECARKNRESMWSPFLNLLTRPDTFIINMTARIIAKLACWSREPMDGSDLTFYLTWLKDQLRTPNNEYMQSVGRCLQMMLRVEEYRTIFYQLDGVVTIVQVLSTGKLNFQIQYQLTFCLWVLTFNNAIAEKMNKF
ncbi:hypothetical protein OTU49_011339 [Cherax quadricarinatus]|uniref:V-type proton ATPase subunit H n=1 Tax=Cherax quadricarinatus TaxID=27406 RepID=A0AAW0W6T6_CHEQU